MGKCGRYNVFKKTPDAKTQSTMNGVNKNQTETITKNVQQYETNLDKGCEKCFGKAKKNMKTATFW